MCIFIFKEEESKRLEAAAVEERRRLEEERRRREEEERKRAEEERRRIEEERRRVEEEKRREQERLAREEEERRNRWPPDGFELVDVSLVRSRLLDSTAPRGAPCGFGMQIGQAFPFEIEVSIYLSPYTGWCAKERFSLSLYLSLARSLSLFPPTLFALSLSLALSLHFSLFRSFLSLSLSSYSYISLHTEMCPHTATYLGDGQRRGGSGVGQGCGG